MKRKQKKSSKRRLPAIVTPKLPRIKGKLPKPRVPRLLGRSEPESKLTEAIESLPRITNETVAEHREELLRGARKYIYPLKHTKHRVVVVSVSLLITAAVLFFAYTILALYRFQSSSTFVYYVTQVLPFPVAKAGPEFVAYENYLFELRHYMHYYQTQQQVNFNSSAGQQQLNAFKKQAIQQVVQDAYVKQLAAKYNVSVSDQEVNNEVTLLRQQNRLGSSDQEFADVLKEFWGWSVNDFKRELKSQLLAQKVVSKLDTGTYARANSALQQLQNGADFNNVAKQVSDDTTTKDNGGQYGYVVSSTDQNLPPQVISELFKLSPGQTSGIINTGYTLEIVKVISVTNGKAQAAHIAFNFQPITSYVAPLQAQKKPHYYIHVQ
ncbi:MAG: peptidylprolyl isomerase [Candidatus Saccharimonadales bacterium]